MTILILCAFGFFASVVDAVAGGGGLIVVPALFVFLPGAPAPVILGTNKFASTCGASAAVTRYALSKKIDWKVAAPAGIAAMALAPLGARAVTLLDPKLVRPLILVLLIGVAAYSLLRKDLGERQTTGLDPRRALAAALTMGTISGFYEGFFGPGNGSLLLFALVGIFGFDFLTASATGRLINFCANVSALIYFIAMGYVRYEIALPLAASAVVGGLVGSRLALRHGAKLIRVLFLVVVAAVLAKFAWDILSGR